jgi:hypothetical protein
MSSRGEAAAGACDIGQCLFSSGGEVRFRRHPLAVVEKGGRAESQCGRGVPSDIRIEPVESAAAEVGRIGQAGTVDEVGLVKESRKQSARMPIQSQSAIQSQSVGKARRIARGNWCFSSRPTMLRARRWKC